MWTDYLNLSAAELGQKFTYAQFGGGGGEGQISPKMISFKVGI